MIKSESLVLWHALVEENRSLGETRVSFFRTNIRIERKRRIKKKKKKKKKKCAIRQCRNKN